MNVTRLKFCVLLPIFLLGLLGCEPKADVSKPKHYSNALIEFDLPANWVVDQDDARKYGRYLFVEEPGDSTTMLMALTGDWDMDLAEFAENQMASFGEEINSGLGKTSEMKRSVDADGAGLRYQFTMTIASVEVPFTADFTKKTWGDLKVIVYTQVSDEDRAKVQPGFDLVRQSLKPVAAVAD